MTARRVRRGLAVPLMLVTVIAAAAGVRDVGREGTPAVVATTTIVGDIVAQIGGDSINLYVMLPTGADPHVFQPTPRDSRQIADARIVFVNGAGLEEGFLRPLIDNALPRQLVELARLGPLRRLENEDGAFDPHVWMDPTLVALWAPEVGRALAAIDPAHASDYRQRALFLTAELLGLDEWVQQQVATVPAERRVIVTDHDVLGYFASRYGFELLDPIIPGFSTAAEPSARHLALLRERIADHHVSAIFVSTTVNSRLAQSVADDLGIAVIAIHTGSLSAATGTASTYQEFIRANVAAITSALR